MLKYKYVIEAEFFSEMEAFQKYLNRKGAEGYELVQWQFANKGFGDILRMHITWKIEDHDS